jgi:hypothetical protein
MCNIYIFTSKNTYNENKQYKNILVKSIIEKAREYLIRRF